MTEIWKDIEDFPNYQVSSTGIVRNKKTGRVTTQKLGHDGRYLSVYLTNAGYENTQRVHRLVAEAFLGKHPGMMVNHIDGNKTNNNVENLEWCTAKENNAHAIKNGLNHPGAYQKRPVRVMETGKIFDGVVACANAIGGDYRNVYAALNGLRKTVNGYHVEYAIPDDPKPMDFLYDYQMDAVNKLFSGAILNGGVGSGKSRTGLFWYFKEQGGWFENGEYTPMKNPKDLYIITTAAKRDRLEWTKELLPFRMYPDPELNPYNNKIAIDSWNNIQKYTDVSGAVFIFDEDRVCGSGAWVKAFLKITKCNEWIILSATPGDTWSDYIPVFVANGFYRNKTEFTNEHIVWKRFVNFPQIDRYVNVDRLVRLRDRILVDMDFARHTTAHHEDVYVKYDISLYKNTSKNRTDPYTQGYIPYRGAPLPDSLLVGRDISVEDAAKRIMPGWPYEPKAGDYVRLVNKPIRNASELCYIWRKIVNTDVSRQIALLEIFEDHPRMIVFYNFDYERDILLNLYYGEDVEIAEWNGHRHQPVPDSESWVYLVQYNAGAEGWNCIKTDTIVFFSQNYSYKIVEQAAGRIDRLNTPYKDLYYYHLKTRSGIDLAISKALQDKKRFNETRYVTKSTKPVVKVA